jgi:hypothetical protein
MGLSLRAFARQRGVTHQTVRKAIARGRLVPLPDGTIDPEAAKTVIEAQRARLGLDRRRGTLLSRDVAVHKAFSFARMVRDAWRTWPARVAPQLAADLGADPAALIIALQDLVRAHLEELASERVEF